jgi:hypothetical protein
MSRFRGFWVRLGAVAAVLAGFNHAQAASLLSTYYQLFGPQHPGYTAVQPPMWLFPRDGELEFHQIRGLPG